ncbi:mechanosensitive ion channel family protein [Candidatus Woesearchaeota archaeon]|nr:mechanosensitive ion channel family protein [Candidatus Woesearchaeota archaeon]
MGTSGYLAVFIVIIAFLTAIAIKYFSEKKLSKSKLISKSLKGYQELFKRILNAFVLLIVITGVYFGFKALGLNIELILFVKIIIIFIAMFLLFLLTNYFTDQFVEKTYKTHNGTSKTIGTSKSKIKLAHFINYFIKLLITLFVIFVLFKFWDVNLLTISQSLIALIKENQLAYAISIFLIYLIVAKILLFIFKTYFTEVVKKTKTKMDDIIVDRVEYPLSWSIILLGILISLNTIDYTQIYAQAYIIPIIKTLIVALVIHTLIKLTDDLLEEWWRETPTTINEDIIQITSNFIKILFIFIGLVILLAIWGLNIKSLLLSVGIISVVLGFALKGTLDNIFSGISLMLEHSFRVGDVIKLETNEVGEVLHIGLRSTKIKTYDNELLVVPNSVLGNMRIINYAKPDNNLRVVLPVNVVYGSDIEKVKKVLLNAVKGMKQISLPNMTKAIFVKMGDYSLDFKLLFFIDDYKNKYLAESQALSLVYNALKKNKIEIPYPTRTLYMNSKRKK